MKKVLFIVLIFVFTLVLSGCGKKQVVNEIIENDEVSAECQELCETASGICPSLITRNQCEYSCDRWSDEVKEKIKNANNCEELSSVEEIVTALIPEMNTPEPINPSNECEAACGSYVGKCLTLVPNATEALYKEGMDSCMKDCANWNTQKVDCMINAFDCEAMTNVCGL